MYGADEKDRTTVGPGPCRSEIPPERGYLWPRKYGLHIDILAPLVDIMPICKYYRNHLFSHCVPTYHTRDQTQYSQKNRGQLISVELPGYLQNSTWNMSLSGLIDASLSSRCMNRVCV